MALTTPGPSPLWSDLQLYPYGFDPVYDNNSLLMVLLTWPVNALFGPVAALNATLLCSVVLGGLFFLLLCRELGCSRFSSFLGGMAYGFSPWLNTHITGHYTLAQIHWVSLAAWLCACFVNEMVHHGQEDAWKPGSQRIRSRWWFPLALGGAVGAACVSDVSLGTMACLLCPVIATCLLWGHFTVLRLPRTWGRVALATITVFVFLSPWAWAVLRARRAHDYSNEPRCRGGEVVTAANWWFWPPATHRFLGNLLWRNPSRMPRLECLYVGAAISCLAVAGLCVRERRRQPWAWGAAAFVFLNLSLANSYTPYRCVPEPPLLGRFWPTQYPFSEFRCPGRFIFAAQFAVAVMAAMGVDALAQRWPKWAVPITGGALGLVALDLLPLTVDVVPAEPIPDFTKLKLDGTGTLLTLPVFVGSSSTGEIGRYDKQQLIDQFVHGKPILTAYLPRIPSDVWDKVYNDRPLRALMAAGMGQPLGELPREVWRDFMKRYRIRWVLLTPEYASRRDLVDMITSTCDIETSQTVNGNWFCRVAGSAGALARQ